MEVQRKSKSQRKSRQSTKRKSKQSKRKSSVRRKSSKTSGGRKKPQSGNRKSLGGLKAVEGNKLARRGRDSFTFINGDKYEGDWLAIYPDIFVRDGEGTYTCSDGTQFDGLWELDLLGTGSITWPCGQKYAGDFQNGKMYGIGTYTFPGRGELSGNFVDNLPIRNVVFLDSAGMKYIGRVDPAKTTVRLGMMNHLMGGFTKEELVLPEPPKEDQDKLKNDQGGRRKSRKKSRRSSKRSSKAGGQRKSMKRKSKTK